MKIELFATWEGRVPVVPAKPQRAWMDTTAEHYAYRCLPLVIANGASWHLLTPQAFTASWDGGNSRDALKVTPEGPGFWPGQSHFGYGILTFSVGYVPRTDPGHNLMVTGPINEPKHGIAPLTGLVEADHCYETFTMNWKFTAPGTVRFEHGEPFASLMVVPRVGLVEARTRELYADPDLKERYDDWSASRASFISSNETGWQKKYQRRAVQTRLTLPPFINR